MKFEVRGGVYPTMITPYKDGKVDYDAYKALIEAQIAGGVDGIHVYTMNNPRVAGRICDGIKNLI